MRSIITGTLVLTIAGLVDAQNPRLVTNYDLSPIQDLVSTGMGEAKATAFIDTVCAGYRIETDGTPEKVHGAINVLTNVTMHWDEYREGPGLNGDPEYNYANYPWSTVSGKCPLVLRSTWVTDRDVVYGVWTDNTNSLSSQKLPVGIYLLTPKSNVTTTLPMLSQYTQNIPNFKTLFEIARPDDAKSLVNSMVWDPADQFRHHTRRIPVDKCTQTRFTAVSATRTIIAVQSFVLSRYYFAVRRISNGVWVSSQARELDKWVELRKDSPGPRGIVVGKLRPTQWSTVYSSGGNVSVDGLALLIPGGTMNMQVQSRPLPPEECN
jgi:hypothetical protein